MVVNSFCFLLFFVVVFIVYFLPVSRNNPRFQNTWLFLVSYFFYGYTDWRMIPLLLGSTVLFYLIGAWLRHEMDKKHTKNASQITSLGVILGIGILIYFKYLNFFADSFADLLQTMGFHVSWNTLNIILPIGVSFFTFKLISYVIEIHREHIQPSENWIDFATYIAFFPTILSGPIDRPNKFIPQLGGARLFNYDLAVDGCRQILWGMFTKMCIADNLAMITDQAWVNYTSVSSLSLLMAALLYPIQLYADFDGYSNMAIGVGKILGFNIARNFNHPFLARNMAEYWRRWHMSLTSWITDYVFMPLNIAFREIGNWGIALAAIINLLVIGLWHGANWTYGVFGLYHGLLFIPLVFSGAFGKKKKLKAGEHGLPHAKDFLKMLGTFVLVSLGLILFRADHLADAILYINNMLGLTHKDVQIGFIPFFTQNMKMPIVIFIVLLFALEWITREKEFPLSISQDSWLSRHSYMRFGLYLVVFLITMCFRGMGSQFIYFKF